jgi:CheY-like chemotaxis protein
MTPGGKADMSTILICDDDAATARALVGLLGQAGHSAHWAANGGEALRVLESLSVDLLVLDEMIPYVSGRELLQVLRLSPRLRQVPVVVWSAIDDPRVIAECRRLGAKDYWIKSAYSWPELQARIESLLAAGTACARSGT